MLSFQMIDFLDASFCVDVASLYLASEIVVLKYRNCLFSATGVKSFVAIGSLCKMSIEAFSDAIMVAYIFIQKFLIHIINSQY